MIRHHPETVLLLDYAAGGLAGPVGLVVASHAWLCPDCRAELARMEALGGAMLSELPPEEMGEDMLAETMARLDADAGAGSPPPVYDAETRSLIPPAVRPYLGGNLGDLKWRRKGLALREARLATGTPGYRASLFRLRPGATAPAHVHVGNEYTLVLDGSFTEDGEPYRVGDFAHAGETGVHVQVADRQAGCVCLTVLDAPVRLRGLAGVLLNPFLRF